MRSERLCYLAAHPTDAQRSDQTPKRAVAAGVDGSDQVGSALVRKAVQRLELIDGQDVDVGRVVKKAGGHQVLRKARAKTFDIHGLAGNPVLDAPHDLGRTGRILAIDGHFALFLDDGFVADRALCGTDVGLLRPVAQGDHGRHDLRDHVPGALDNDGIAHADIFAGQVLKVVQ